MQVRVQIASVGDSDRESAILVMDLTPCLLKILQGSSMEMLYYYSRKIETALVTCFVYNRSILTILW
ncbi:hypothetical protein P8452_09603 [Trifolium repens]|nr:hypothetical protein P8452_09603 [Trifolium repens]